MIELSKTDAKHLAVVEPYLETIQEFIDEHIKDGNAMTAAAIHEKYRSEYETEDDIADVNDFVKGFRAAVRAGEITGIEGAQRLGYRRIGDTVKTKTAIDTTLEQIETYIEDLQAFVDLYIKDGNKMTAAAIYERFKKECGCDLDEDVFVKGFRAALAKNKIQGIASAGRYGYKQIEHSDSADDADVSAPVGAEICIGEDIKLSRMDKYNWVVMVRNSGDNWVRKGNYGSEPWAALHMAQRLLKTETDRNLPYDVKDLLKTVQEAHENLAKLLAEALTLAKGGAFGPADEEQDAA
jgi:hypothetical protein